MSRYSRTGDYGDVERGRPAEPAYGGYEVDRGAGGGHYAGGGGGPASTSEPAIGRPAPVYGQPGHQPVVGVPMGPIPRGWFLPHPHSGGAGGEMQDGMMYSASDSDLSPEETFFFVMHRYSRLIQLLAIIQCVLYTLSIIIVFDQDSLWWANIVSALGAIMGWIGARRFNKGLVGIYVLSQVFDVGVDVYWLLMVDGTSETEVLITVLNIVLGIIILWYTAQFMFRIPWKGLEVPARFRLA